MDWDVFISHAWEDKEPFVRSLAEALKREGLRVWYDEFTLRVGDSLRRSIDHGLANSRYGIVILSPNFFAKEWPQKELDGLVAREVSGENVILPVWHNVTADQVRKYSLTLIDRVAASSERSLEYVVKELLRAIKPISELERQPFEPEMILIPAGEFLMGSDSQKDRYAKDNEQPQHTLYLPDYYLAKTPVTNAQYAVFVQATDHDWPEHWIGGRSPSGTEDHPVMQVSWHEAVAYCYWLAEVTGRPYRLPSEAEWEKGARGSNGHIYPWGDQWDAKRCNSLEGDKGYTTPVGAYPQGASPYDLLDMAGNVWEWTRSLWGEHWLEPLFKYPYKPADGREDLDAPVYIRRVVRGGAFVYDRWDVRCAVRFGYHPFSRDMIYGFRLCLVSQQE